MGVVHLTFDDGPDPEWTPRVLAELERVGARATFFVIGELAARHPELVRRALEAGHRVELHCMRHLMHPLHPRATIEADTREALEVLAGVGVRPGYWRPPRWGARELERGARRLARAAADPLVGGHDRLARGPAGGDAGAARPGPGPGRGRVDARRGRAGRAAP